MTITRQSTIPPSFSMAELLSFLQVDGRLREVAVPHWATDTSVEELLDALRLIGDGEWLLEMPEYGGHSPQDAADKWLRNFMEGRPVCHPDDRILSRTAVSTASESPAAEDDEDESEYLEASFVEYMATLSPAARARFKKRVESSSAVKAAALTQISIMSKILVACALADEERFQAERDCLSPLAMDKDMRAISLHYLDPDIRGAMFEHFRENGADIVRAEKRARDMRAKLKKTPAE